MKRSYLCGASVAAVAIGAISWSTAAYAADAAEAASSAPSEVSEVVVTGSYIQGTAKDTALPVSVISSDDLAKQGAPSTVELIKNLPASSGVLGDTNQFDARAQGSEGSGSINLRGLGPARTLVLLNGRRLTLNPRGVGVDTNALPVTAIQRVEVLKDGAAATYGSDAIGGVVNFITKKNQTGIDVNGTYAHIAGSNGDWTLGATAGWQNENLDVTLSAGYQHRSELRVIDRDWAHLPLAANPQGGWSAASNPGTFIALTGPAGVNPRFIDPACSALGNVPVGGSTPLCEWQYTQFDNLVEDEDHWQLFGAIDYRISDNHKFHLDAFYSKTELPTWRTSPSYAFLQTPTAQDGGVGGQYYIPASNPGLIAFKAANPNIAAFTNCSATVHPTCADLGYTFGQAVTVPASSLNGGALLVAARPFGIGGNPEFGYDSSRGDRRYEAFRVSGGFNGEIMPGVNYDIALTYSLERSEQGGRDTLVERFQRALNGLGGPDCPLTGGTPGVGPCMYYNPFANAIPGNAITGAANPSYNSAVSNNNTTLINWFFPFVSNNVTTKIFVADGVLSGKLGGFTLPGGEIGWAVGGQYRKNYYESVIGSFGNLNDYPCIDSPDFHDNSCLNTPAGATSPFVFLGGAKPLNVTNSVWAVFGEVNLPITDTLNVQGAARFEDYGGGVGNTFNPQARAKWQVVPWFALRGSIGTTFRAPPPTQTDPGSVTSLQNIGGTFRAVRIFGNPNLKPETAFTFNVGGILEVGHFTATIDYWSFNFKKPLITEPVAGIVNAMFPGGASTNCTNHPEYAALLSRFVFNLNGCGIGNVVRLDTNTINGPQVKTAGIDFSADYRV
ncbi:MAG TPA: TonB-dependent receptor, partial [Caulobacteraceae bacterium]|nr:TonB-dependent receptor [Caulobacteraceae bacterium]